MTSANASSRHVEREDVLLWLFAFVPVLAWIVAQSVSFLATRSICATGHRWLLYLVMGTSLAAAIAAGAFSWTNWTRWRGLATYRRFMALGGIFLAAICTVSILSLLIPATLHRVCD